MKEYIVQAYSQETIDSFDAHNAPELIRCKDCKWWHESETHKGYGDCGQANGITLKSSDWFCADGEKKDAEND
jgi:hypothetical protein